MTELISVSGSELTGQASVEDRRIVAVLRGNADHVAVPALESLLARIHVEAQRLAIEEVIIDLRELEFMNSSCFKSFVTWVSDVQELEPPRQYKIVFLSNLQLHWQKRSLHALRCFAVMWRAFALARSSSISRSILSSRASIRF